MRTLLYYFPCGIQLFYCNLLEEIVDLNKLLSIFVMSFVEEVRDDYFLIIPRRTNGSKKNHILLYEEYELNPIKEFALSICNFNWNLVINEKTCAQASFKLVELG
jgi:hypothetical protein